MEDPWLPQAGLGLEKSRIQFLGATGTVSLNRFENKMPTSQGGIGARAPFQRSGGLEVLGSSRAWVGLGGGSGHGPVELNWAHRGGQSPWGLVGGPSCSSPKAPPPWL